MGYKQQAPLELKIQKLKKYRFFENQNANATKDKEIPVTIN